MTEDAARSVASMGERDNDEERALSIALRRRAPQLVIVDGEGNPVMTCIDPGATPGAAASALLDEGARVAVRNVIAEMNATGESAGVILFSPTVVLRVSSLAGSAGVYYAVFIERFESRNLLADARSRYGLSPREIAVLTLVLRGLSTIEIADELCIAATTVLAHVKNIARKTNSTKRTEILAKLLGLR